MILSEENLIQLEGYAIQAARKAGKYISETRPLDIQHKEGGESLASQVLTEVDQQSQDLILNVLERTFSEYDLALLTEESEDNGSRLKKDYFWCIDPIDGTLPFIESIPGYAVSIALVSRTGAPMIGVVYDPVEHTLYHAVKGQGAFRNSKPWRISEQGSRLQVFTDRSIAQQPYFTDVIKALDADFTDKGGAIMNALWCLVNPPAAYFKFPKKGNGGGSLWDFASTACIYSEIGAVATDITGEPLELNRADSTYMNHFGILYATDPELAKTLQNLYKKAQS